MGHVLLSEIQDVWPEQTKIGVPVTCSTSHFAGYKQALNTSCMYLNVNVPKELIDIILFYLDETKVGRLHLMNSTHYIQININYLIDEYWNGVVKYN